MTMTLTKVPIKSITKEELAQMILTDQPVQILAVLDSRYFNSGSLYNVIKTCASRSQENAASFDFAFDTVFIKGSKIVMLDQLKLRLGELDRNQEVVTYSTGDDIAAAFKAARVLVDRGLKARILRGGIKEWSRAGLPTE